MNAVRVNPRSTLHALEPQGLGTPDVESMLSYLCRLAYSHSTSTLSLTRLVAERARQDISPGFDWHERKLAGLGESALNMSAALSALTSVHGLDGLTFLPWREVIAPNGVALVSRGQFCPHCFDEDRASGRSPYFRLAWESSLVSVCPRHKTPLQTHCPSCGQDNVRHKAAFVVPGWCCRCGEFLGAAHADEDANGAVEPAELWRARQVSQLLAAQDGLSMTPSRSQLMTALNAIILQMDGGQGAVFARRIGIGKSTVHHWLKGTGTPTLGVSLSIASQCGLSLTQLLTGDIADWQPPSRAQQMTFQFLNPEREERATARELDWAHIDAQLHGFLLLPTPVSVLEAARRLDVEARQLYLRANKTTRMLGKRWLDYVRRRQEAQVLRAWPYLEAASMELLKQGRAVTRRSISAMVPADILNSVPQLLDVLKEVQAHIELSNDGLVSRSS
jgi:transcriptional regulator with XRE-family HTH domain